MWSGPTRHGGGDGQPGTAAEARGAAPKKKEKKWWGAETKSKGERWLLRPAACVSQRLVMSLSNHFLMPLAERSEVTQVL